MLPAEFLNSLYELFRPFFGTWNVLDVVLVILLTIGLGVLRFSNARSRDKAVAPNIRRRALKTFVLLGIPLPLLLIDWIGAGRAPDLLGLACPSAWRSKVGLGIAVLVIVTALLDQRFRWPKASPEKRGQMLEQLSKAGLAPANRTELIYSVLLAFVIGIGTEVLFRGFLIWALSPIVGLWGAVVIAALAYGLGHGDESWRRILAATVSAFIFTIAYALTHSLWWLMTIHVWIALQGVLIGYHGLQKTLSASATSFGETTPEDG